MVEKYIEKYSVSNKVAVNKLVEINKFPNSIKEVMDFVNDSQIKKYFSYKKDTVTNTPTLIEKHRSFK